MDAPPLNTAASADQEEIASILNLFDDPVLLASDQPPLLHPPTAGFAAAPAADADQQQSFDQWMLTLMDEAGPRAAGPPPQPAPAWSSASLAAHAPQPAGHLSSVGPSAGHRVDEAVHPGAANSSSYLAPSAVTSAGEGSGSGGSGSPGGGGHESPDGPAAARGRRQQSQAGSGAASRAVRERARRERLNDMFAQLSMQLDPSKPYRTDKYSVASDALTAITALHSEKCQLLGVIASLEERLRVAEQERQGLQQALVTQIVATGRADPPGNPVEQMAAPSSTKLSRNQTQIVGAQAEEGAVPAPAALAAPGEQRPAQASTAAAGLPPALVPPLAAAGSPASGPPDGGSLRGQQLHANLAAVPARTDAGVPRLRSGLWAHPAQLPAPSHGLASLTLVSGTSAAAAAGSGPVRLHTGPKRGPAVLSRCKPDCMVSCCSDCSCGGRASQEPFGCGFLPRSAGLTSS